MKNLPTVVRVLLGLLMLFAGLGKLVRGADGVSGMLSGMFLFAWAPMFWAWVLILSEIAFGIAIIANWKLKYTSIPPMIILTVAVLFSTFKWELPAMSVAGLIGWQSWNNLFFHLIAIAGYYDLFLKTKK